MLRNLGVLHFPGDSSKLNEQFGSKVYESLAHISQFSAGDGLIIKTCQRTLVIYYFASSHCPMSNIPSEYFHGHPAYSFLLEVLCGLKSKILGENEISNQFKIAYQNYLKLPNRHPQLLDIMEKLFKDAKKIRTDHLKEIGQHSYAGIARKIVQNTPGHGPKSCILLFGSGTLAEEVISQFNKRYKIFICARNQERITKLKEKWPNLQVVEQNFSDGECRSNYFKFSIIINTIGTEQTLFDQSFFEEWRKENNSHGPFIDLGPASVVQTSWSKKEGIYRLKDLFDHGVVLNHSKNEKIKNAKEQVLELSSYRSASFNLNLPFSWEELQMA